MKDLIASKEIKNVDFFKSKKIHLSNNVIINYKRV